MPKQKNLPKKIPTNLKEYDNFLDIVNNLNESIEPDKYEAFLNNVFTMNEKFLNNVILEAEMQELKNKMN
jgi:hypothetical protein